MRNKLSVANRFQEKSPLDIFPKFLLQTGIEDSWWHHQADGAFVSDS